MGGYGNLVEIDNGNGLATRYAHLSSIDVTQGESVATGSIVGHIGDTGRATGPHLHYEVVSTANRSTQNFFCAQVKHLPPISHFDTVPQATVDNIVYFLQSQNRKAANTTYTSMRFR